MNIKIYHWDINKLDAAWQEEIRKNMSCRITENGSNLTFELKLPFKKAVREIEPFTLDTAANREKVLELLVVETDKFAVVKAIPIYDYISRENGYTLPEAHSDNRTKVARIIIDDTGDVFIAMTWWCDDIEGFDNITLDQNSVTVKSRIMTDCPWYAEKVAALNKKKKLIGNTNIYRNVAYLEAQVDVLTRLVLQLANNKCDKELIKVLQAADAESVLNLKSTDALTTEFTKNKADFRKLQKKYHETL